MADWRYPSGRISPSVFATGRPAMPVPSTVPQPRKKGEEPVGLQAGMFGIPKNVLLIGAGLIAVSALIAMFGGDK